MICKNVYSIVLLLTLFVLPACFESKPAPMRTCIIQLPFDSSIIGNLQKKVEPIITNIIIEEAGVAWDEKIPFFFFKKRAAITVYYVNDMRNDGESLLFSAVEIMQKIPAPQGVTITSKVDFFGEPKQDQLAILDLVVVIDDPNDGLSRLNAEVKKAIHAANEQYTTTHNHSLYDRAKSERFPYLPHLSLGHLRENYIRHVMNGASKADADTIIARIKQRIIVVVSQALADMSVEERSILFDKLSIYDAQKRTYINEVLFQ
jgi:hypothetical protein